MPSTGPPSRGKRSGSADRRGLALALLSGALLGAAFLPAPLGFLAWFGFVPLLVALEAATRVRRGARALFALGYAYGFTFYLIGTHWIARLSDVAITVPWLKYPAWVAAALYLGLFGGLATLAAGALARRARVPLALTFPLALVAAEELRGSGELGFPWFQPGYSQHEYVPLLQLASLGGVMLVTLWLAVVNVLAWRALAGRARLRAGAGALLLLLLPWLWGQRVLDASSRAEGPVVALVQPNIAGEIKWAGTHQRQILDTLLTLSARAAAADPRPALVVWPETATGSYMRRQPEQALAIARFVARDSVPLFAGYADYGFAPDGRTFASNAAGLFAPGRMGGPAYAKRHLVPFGERMPFQWLVPAIGRWNVGQAEWTPGREPVLFPSAAGPFSALICFESIFGGLARDDVRRGARWLVNVTNDEWFGNGAALTQHAAMAVFRAVEHRVPLARCANTGLTMIVDGYGRVTARLPVFREAVLAAPLPRPGPETPYTRVGDWPGVLCVALLAGVALAGFAGRVPRALRRE